MTVFECALLGVCAVLFIICVINSCYIDHLVRMNNTQDEINAVARETMETMSERIDIVARSR